MRLSTVAPRVELHAIAVIHAALDAGATLLDTADAYCLDETDVGHNERLIAHALHAWTGDRTRVTVATKGGLRRPNGRWVPDGRAAHLKAACEASRRALDVDVIELYQLHTADPRTPFATSVRALAALQRDGHVKRIGLCNVTVAQIEAARAIAEISSVQVSVSVFDDENLRNGVAEYCREHDITLIAYRPLGGERAARLPKEPILSHIAQRHAVTAQEIALAWLRDLAPHIIPIPGATTVEHARSLERVLAVRLDADDRTRLDARYPAGSLLRQPRALRRPTSDASGDVLLIMGMPGAGKSTLARSYVDRGYERLNRDATGGGLADLVAHLDRTLTSGQKLCVLDNTYASRAARSRVIESAWQHGVPVRCLWLQTSLADAQINAVTRLLDVHGHLPTPEELRERGKIDPRFFGPDAQFRYERQLEPPSLDEGFAELEVRGFERTRRSASQKILVLEYDDVLVSAPGALHPEDISITEERREVLARYHGDGWLLLSIAWRPQIAAGTTTATDVAACFTRTRELLGVPISLAYCPHAAGPPVCWCRKPLPGLVLEALHGHDIAFEHSIVVGRSPADRTLADKLGMSYRSADEFFAAT